MRRMQYHTYILSDPLTTSGGGGGGGAVDWRIFISFKKFIII